MSDQSSSLPDGTNAATGVDKAMKQFSQTDAERERPSTDEEGNSEDKAKEQASSGTQPPRSDAPAEKPATPQ